MHALLERLTEAVRWDVSLSRDEAASYGLPARPIDASEASRLLATLTRCSCGAIMDDEDGCPEGCDN